MKKSVYLSKVKSNNDNNVSVFSTNFTHKNYTIFLQLSPSWYACLFTHFCYIGHRNDPCTYPYNGCFLVPYLSFAYIVNGSVSTVVLISVMGTKSFSVIVFVMYTVI